MHQLCNANMDDTGIQNIEGKVSKKLATCTLVGWACSHSCKVANQCLYLFLSHYWYQSGDVCIAFLVPLLITICHTINKLKISLTSLLLRHSSWLVYIFILNHDTRLSSSLTCYHHKMIKIMYKLLVHIQTGKNKVIKFWRQTMSSD